MAIAVDMLTNCRCPVSRQHLNSTSLPRVRGNQSKDNEGKKDKKEVEWKPVEKIAMTIRKGDERKQNPKTMMELKEGHDKKQGKDE